MGNIQERDVKISARVGLCSEGRLQAKVDSPPYAYRLGIYIPPHFSSSSI
jgi:hypothetical protein